MYHALLLDIPGDQLTASVKALGDDRLPEGDVLLDVLYSSLNYKDGLAVTGEGKIVRGDYPFVPGIDLVGRVKESSNADFAVGDEVVGTGWGLGEEHWGGYAQRQRVQSDWLVPLPEGMTPRQAMVAGTAGFTAMLSVMALEEHGVAPESGEVVVTGASGGVGSLAVALLAALGYDAVASTGSEDAQGYLSDLGAARRIPREEMGGGPKRPMESARWAGAVDTVGGDTLAAVLATLGRHGSVAACGNAGGAELHTTVFPFILRGVSLLGIDSNTCPTERRRAAWQRLAGLLTEDHYARITDRVIGLADVPQASRALLDGAVRGRVVVDVNA